MKKLTNKQKEEVTKRFSDNALKMMKKRYLVIDEKGNQETPADMFARVGTNLAQVEQNYGKSKKFIEKVAKDFFEIMARKEYTPAGRTVRNAGSNTPLIANCVVLPIHDSMESIFQTLKDAALLQQVGCGLGFDLSEMRPAMFPTKRTEGVASGPITFLGVYNAAFGTIKQQSRHGANMAMMRIDHPDVLDFIHCKEKEGEIRNFNISVTVTDEFMEALQKNPNQQWYSTFGGKKYKPQRVFRHPSGSVYDTKEVDITVKELFDEIVQGAWRNGEPGIAFLDTWNKANPLPDLGPLAATNPCGEQTLHPYDNCNLGSLNLAMFVKQGKIDHVGSKMSKTNQTSHGVDWNRLRFATRTAVRLMDNVIDRFDFPVEQCNETARKNRRIGLGIMGFADMLFQLGVKYNSEEGFKTAEKVVGFINNEAYKMSQELAKEKGVFPNYQKSVFAKKTAHSLAQEPGIGKKMRNVALTTVAPTGSISMMFDCSSGIEPNFALSYVKQDKDGNQYHYFNRYFETALNALKLSKKEKDEILQEILKTGSIQNLKQLPQQLRDTFVVAMDIPGEDHMRIQAAFQKYVDNSISKTINFPNSATKEEIAKSFLAAWKLGCKSCTVYREGSRAVQILNLGTGENIVAPSELPAKKEEKLELKMDKSRLTPRPRPGVVSGKTYKVKTGYGNLYITVNNDEKGQPFEVFATIGKSGGFFQEQSEAICRLISLALRSGVKIQEVVEQLEGIRGPMPIFTEKGTILSLPDAIGKIIREHAKNANHIEEILQRPENQEVLPFTNNNEEKHIANFGFMPGCPDCGSPLIMSEGCMNCKGCGFSRCT